MAVIKKCSAIFIQFNGFIQKIIATPDSLSIGYRDLRRLPIRNALPHALKWALYRSFNGGGDLLDEATFLEKLIKLDDNW